MPEVGNTTIIRLTTECSVSVLTTLAAITRVNPLTSELKDNKTALEYLKKSIEIGDQGPYCNTDENKANTFLNIASVYSSAGKHDVALSFC